MTSHARGELLNTALAIGLPEPEARQTLESGFTAGAREPRSASAGDGSRPFPFP